MNRITYILYFLSFTLLAQVPDTNGFTLSDVTAVVGGTSLSEAFANADPLGFDASYAGDFDKLSDFRNYHDPEVILVMETTSTSSTWQFTEFVYGGYDLEWVVTGDATGTYNGITPVIDLSGNTGTATITVTGVDTQASSISCNTLSITSIDVSNNVNLRVLRVHYNDISVLDVSSNTELEILECYATDITILDTSNCVYLIQLLTHSTNLTSLNVSNNVNLENLRCQNTDLTSLDVSDCISLTDLRVFSSSLTDLDVSNNVNLTTLRCQTNPLTSTSKDNIYIDLYNHGLSNGTLVIDSGRTAASDTARANLITKSWSITEL